MRLGTDKLNVKKLDRKGHRLAVILSNSFD